MIKPLHLALLLSAFSCAGALGQTFSTGNSGGFSLGDSSPAPIPAAAANPVKKDADKAPSGPTVIDSEAMDYDGKTRVAVFTGDNYGVFVKDPSFTVNCNKLTATMRTAGAAGAGAKGKPSAAPSASPAGKAGAATTKASGLQRAVAEGPADQPVVIVQDKPATNGEEAQHDVGIAQKADYNADTGDIILTGWPRVSQGINTQIATSVTTIMIMNKDGRTMKTIGPSHTVIQEQDQPKKGNTSATPAQSPQ